MGRKLSHRVRTSSASSLIYLTTPSGFIGDHGRRFGVARIKRRSSKPMIGCPLGVEWVGTNGSVRSLCYDVDRYARRDCTRSDRDSWCFRPLACPLRSDRPPRVRLERRRQMDCPHPGCVARLPAEEMDAHQERECFRRFVWCLQVLKSLPVVFVHRRTNPPSTVNTGTGGGILSPVTERCRVVGVRESCAP